VRDLLSGVINNVAICVTYDKWCQRTSGISSP